MKKYWLSILSAFLATVVLTIIMIIKTRAGILPYFDVVRDMAIFTGATSPAWGWFWHFVIGTFVWGIVFAFIFNWLKGHVFWKGIEFGIIAWLLMMIIYMPVMGWGFFASHLGGSVIFASLILHLIYGAVLGLFYGWFAGKFGVK